MKGIERTMILVIFAVLMLILVLAVFSLKVYPLIRWGIFSPCWGSFTSKMGSFTGIEFLRKPQTIIVGECAGSIMFVNKEAPNEYFEGINEDYMRELNCKEDGASYVLGFPANELKPEKVGWNVFKWPKKVWQEMKDFWLHDLGGVKPICNVLDKERAFIDPKGKAIVYDPKEGVKTYCIEVKLTSDKKNYEVKIDEGPCGKEDKKEGVGIPIE